MDKTIQTVKEFSPYGWGVTFCILAFNMWQDTRTNNNTLYSKEISDLKDRITAVEQITFSVKNDITFIRADIRALTKMGCNSLSKAQKQVAIACED